MFVSDSKREDRGMCSRFSSAIAVMIAFAAAGCSEEGPARGEDDTLDPEQIAALTAQFPVLSEAPAPPPEPSPTASGAVPDHLRNRLPEPVLESATGEATFYADSFEGRRTASGIPFRQNQLVAAHRGFPFGTVLRVTNTRSGRQVRVRVVDRGPFSSGEGGERRVIDLSRRAAAELGFVDAGTAEVRIDVLQWGEGLPTG